MNKRYEIFSSENFFSSFTFLDKMRQSIGSYFIFNLTVIGLKIIQKNFLGLLDLPETKAVNIHKLLNIVIISENKNCKFAAF